MTPWCASTAQVPAGTRCPVCLIHLQAALEKRHTARTWLPRTQGSGDSPGHAPQIAGETEVKALIKLRLRTPRDAAIVVFRSFSLTQNKSKKTFKTLDGSVMVQDDETGEMKVLTNKCAEMDKTVPYVMNVSRPILEHVVFVHQEDSLWPLSESKPLKEKFDAIFAATKYTAGLQKIKDDIKEKNQVCVLHASRPEPRATALWSTAVEWHPAHPCPDHSLVVCRR